MRSVISIFLLLAVLSACARGANPVVDINRHGAGVVLEDKLSHLLYWWPATLLEYDIPADTDIDSANLRLVDKADGTIVPFQVYSHDGARHLYIKTDLPSGARREFGFMPAASSAAKIPVKLSDGFYEVSTSKFSVKIPASASGREVPGPVYSVSDGSGKWYGKSSLTSGKGDIVLSTTMTADGPLFAEFELVYAMPDKSVYKSVVRCIDGYDFVELSETMDGFGSDGSRQWTIDWTGFNPTHRQAPNHPYGAPKAGAKGFDLYDWEEADKATLNSHHGIIASTDTTGRVPFDVGIYGNWPAEDNVTSAVFWDPAADRSIGLFVRGIDGWDNRQYPIWVDPHTLSIKMYCRDGRLRWAYPLVDGTRTSAISFYPHNLDIDHIEKLEELSVPHTAPSGARYQAVMGPQSYNTFLQNRYSTICLDDVKNWQLEYPDSLTVAKNVFDNRHNVTPAEFEQQFFYGRFSNELPCSGTCQDSGYGPTSSRLFYEDYTGLMSVLRPQMSDELRRRLTAMFLVHAYVAAGEEYMPMRHMLGGHPNFLADVKSVPAFAAYLFPDHPEAARWADVFEKHIDLNMQYHVRPDVKAWDSRGGRWTENLSTYIWAAMRPMLRANYLAERYYDGKNRLASPKMARLADYVMNSLSAPFAGESADFYKNEKGEYEGRIYWGIATPDRGSVRVMPPLGAHAVRRLPPSGYWLLGKELENYDPLLSENIRYVARPDYMDTEFFTTDENSFSFMYVDSLDTGTPPSLRSSKYTGSGVVLRAGADKDEELSVHLMQVDNGPNYRWGITGDGGCGTVYFYADGKSFSNNDKEDIGDRRLNDTDLATGFGVFKDGRFKAIGRNDLTEPLYDLGSGQFARITASEQSAYSWPEYQSRSIMLLGNDYFMIFDDVFNQNIAGRFSWFTHLEDDFPDLQNVKGGGPGYVFWDTKPDEIHITGPRTKGVWFDGTGDFLTFVSHKKGYTTQKAPYGCVVTSPAGLRDHIFITDTQVNTAVRLGDDSISFAGTAGYARALTDGKQEWALFHGKRIADGNFAVSVPGGRLGINAKIAAYDEISGRVFAPEAATVEFEWNDLPKGIAVYIDGVRQNIKPAGTRLTVDFPAGAHLWNITKGLPDMPAPEIAYTENRKGTVAVAVNPVPSASSYIYEYSTDQGRSWDNIKRSGARTIVLKPLHGEGKGYVRVKAANRDKESAPSVIYPVYFTSELPAAPAGLEVTTDCDTRTLSWGRVLGCDTYRLYRKLPGRDYELIYSGGATEYTDSSRRDGAALYAVCAVNGNGKGELSAPVTDDPACLLNITPAEPGRFRRSVIVGGGKDLHDNNVPTYYPD